MRPLRMERMCHNNFNSHFVTPMASSLATCCPVSFPFLHSALWLVSHAPRWLWIWSFPSLGMATWPFSSRYSVSWLNILDHAPLLSQVNPTMSSRLLYSYGRSCLFCRMLTTQGESLWSLGSDKKARLDRLGVQWEGLEWQMNFEGLLKFRAVSGHCDVPKDHRLSPWVVNMRQNRHDLPYEYKSLL